MLAPDPEPHLQLVASFVCRTAKHSRHDRTSKRVASVLADKGLVVNVVVSLNLQVVAVFTFSQ